MLLSFAPFRALATSLLGLGSPSTVQVVGDAYLDIIAKIDELPQWDGDTAIRSPIETVAGGSALNTAVQLSALCRTRRQRDQPRPFRRCVLHSRVGSDLYGERRQPKTTRAHATSVIAADATSSAASTRAGTRTDAARPPASLSLPINLSLSMMHGSSTTPGEHDTLPLTPPRPQASSSPPRLARLA